MLLDHLLGSLPPGSRGTDLLVETTLGKLLNAIRSDLELKTTVRDPERLLDRALLWLHEQEIIRLNKGLAVFRPAMSIRLSQEQRRFTPPPTSHRSSSITRTRCSRFMSWRNMSSGACRP